MSNKKKPYEKPTLKGVDMLEMSAATCCKTGLAICAPFIKASQGKSNNISTAS